MSITTERCLLMNNLIYLGPEMGPYPMPDTFVKRKVRDWLEAIDLTQLHDPDPKNLPMTTAGEWKSIILAAKRDSFLMDMTILEMYTDLAEGGGSGRNAVFLSEASQEALVVFKGTDLIGGAAQWKDNFLSGNMADSPHQQGALQWYRECCRKFGLQQYEITVTGHSKGGNKAKYVAILDDSADHCVSFDGEGFSDKFFRKYAPQIMHRAGRISNHMINYDYISPLMNDVGDAVYYYGYNIGTGGFIENHLPNTFMRFEDDGSFTLDVDPGGRSPEMIALDCFIHSYLRSMNDEERTGALAMNNDMVNAAFMVNRTMDRREIIRIFADLAQDDENRRHMAYMIAYVIRYGQRFPESVDMLNSVFSRFGMEGMIQYVNLVANIINWKTQILWVSLDFSKVASAVSAISSRAPGFFHSKMKEYLDKKGIPLEEEELKTLEDIIVRTEEYIQMISVEEDVTDRNLNADFEE
ncbi:MAG: DUF2974 domain-containing protein [Solobacterium sp.]|nr:DUF2974 domain-containing protein [Solobacterium sp.]